MRKLVIQQKFNLGKCQEVARPRDIELVPLDIFYRGTMVRPVPNDRRATRQINFLLGTNQEARFSCQSHQRQSGLWEIAKVAVASNTPVSWDIILLWQGLPNPGDESALKANSSFPKFAPAKRGEECDLVCRDVISGNELFRFEYAQHVAELAA